MKHVSFLVASLSLILFVMNLTDPNPSAWLGWFGCMVWSFAYGTKK